MRRLLRHRLLFAISIVCTLPAAAPMFAQTNPAYVQFSPGAVKGALYKPDRGPAPHVAVLVIHRTSNFLAHPATRAVPEVGGSNVVSISTVVDLPAPFGPKKP